MSSDRAGHADARDVPEIGDGRKRPDFTLRGRGHGLRDRMLRGGLDGAGEPQDVGARSAVQQRDVRELHAARGHRARLVEDDRRDPPRALEDLRAFDEDPELRAATRADHESRRRGEPERAGARDDEDGDRRREGRRRIARDDEPTRERRQ